MPSSTQVSLTYNDNNTITVSNDTAGMRIMKDSFGLVTKTDNITNVILLDN